VLSVREFNHTRTLWVDFNTEQNQRLSTRWIYPGDSPLSADPPRVGERVILNDGEGTLAGAVVESVEDGVAVLVVDPPGA
jgi:hypothetical protein